MVDEERRLIVTDEEGNEIEMEILFTFDKDDKNYVVYHNPNNEDEEVMDIFAAIYDEQGNLYPIESDEEWQTVEEMLEAFADDELEEDK